MSGEIKSRHRMETSPLIAKSDVSDLVWNKAKSRHAGENVAAIAEW